MGVGRFGRVGSAVSVRSCRFGRVSLGVPLAVSANHEVTGLAVTQCQSCDWSKRRIEIIVWAPVSVELVTLGARSYNYVNPSSSW